MGILLIRVLFTYIEHSIIKPTLIQYKNTHLGKRREVFCLQQEIDYAKLGLNIKKLRQSKKMTQENLAELIGCNPSHISNIENSYTKASLNTLLSIANILDTSIDYLLLNQYNNQSLALDNEIAKAVADCDIETKERILRIIKVL